MQRTFFFIVALMSLAAATAAASSGKLVYHMDFNTIMPTRAAVSGALRMAVESGCDAILWETEDKVRWETCLSAMHSEAFSKEEFRAILDEARSLGLEPIPLLQTVGHGEYVLDRPEYAAFRERADRKDCYCVSKPEVRAFLLRRIEEQLELFGKDVKWFHLGGDEAWSFAQCPVCRARDRLELFAGHMDAMAAPLRLRGIRPGCWNDMIQARPREEGGWENVPHDAPGLKAMPRDFIVWFWDYNEGIEPCYVWSGRSGELSALGFDVVFCAASQCGGDSPFLVKADMHRANIAAAAEIARRNAFAGLCVTAWSVRQGTKAQQRPFLEFAAKRYRNPGPDAGAEFDAIVRRFYCGGAAAESLCDVSSWVNSLYSFDGRGWHRYKDAQPPPPGEIKRVLARLDGEGADARAKCVERAKEGAGRIRKGLAHVTANELLEGGRLNLRLLETILAALEERPIPPVPFDETVAYYSREQTPASATNSAAIVWGFYLKEK